MMSPASSNNGSALWVHGLWALVAVAAFGGGYLASKDEALSGERADSSAPPPPRVVVQAEEASEADPARVAESFPKAPAPGNAPIFEGNGAVEGTNTAQVSPTPLPTAGAPPVLETTDDALPPRGSELTPDQAHRLLSGTVWFQPGGIPSSQVPVTAETPLVDGQHLQVKWGEQWWAGTITGFEPDGRVRIHYFGWADSWDEAKSREELQIDPTATLRAVDTVYRRRK